jgi:hypothetical protein
MRMLLTGYVVSFNRRHKRHGHLFQNRYKSIVCQEDVYLRELVRYIHLNPIRTGIVPTIKDMVKLGCKNAKLFFTEPLSLNNKFKFRTPSIYHQKWGQVYG